MELVGYAASLVMGLVLGIIGGGGSILTVPILVYLFGLSPTLASGYSLFIVGLTAAIGLMTYVRRHEVDFRTGVVFAIPSFLGVFLVRAFLIPAIPRDIASLGGFELTKDLLIMVVFAGLMVAASVSMIRSRKPGLGEGHRKELTWIRGGAIGLEGLVVGGVTGFVGAGGGFLIIPALVVLVGLPMKIAVGTSLMIISIKSLFGFLGDLRGGALVDWVFLMTLSVVAIAGTLLGSRLGTKVPEAKLKKAFGWFVLVMGTGILLQQLMT